MAYDRRPLAERFWSHVEKTDGCWNWKGSLRPNGYGRLSVANRSVGTHRLSWELINGPVPEGLSVLHRCDNRRCVRPDHLFVGTQAENIADRDRKGRNLIGARSPNTSLTEAQVLKILQSRPVGKSALIATRKELAVRFGVSPRAIKAIQLGQNWKHIQRAV